VWLDPEKTTPYQFYQFWLNVSDEDAAKYIKIFTVLSQEEITGIVAEHNKAPHERLLQKRLAEEVTVMVHSREDYDSAVEVSQILFGKGTTETLKKMGESTFLSVFEGVPVFEVKMEVLQGSVTLADLCVEHSQVFSSKGELRRLIQGGGLSLNKVKIDNPEMVVHQDLLLNNKYLLVQKGKKSYYLIRVS
jgi:tyrosyl-tRNA synthetase